jgi:hypothetical protein
MHSNTLAPLVRGRLQTAARVQPTVEVRAESCEVSAAPSSPNLSTISLESELDKGEEGPSLFDGAIFRPNLETGLLLCNKPDYRKKSSRRRDI